MKKDTIKILKEKGKFNLFSIQRYDAVKDVMKIGMKKDIWLNNYLSLDPLNKSQWIADHLIKFVENGHLK